MKEIEGKIIDTLDSYFEREPKAQDGWSKGYACIKKGRIRELSSAILSLVRGEIKEEEIKEIIDWISEGRLKELTVYRASILGSSHKSMLDDIAHEIVSDLYKKFGGEGVNKKKSKIKILCILLFLILNGCCRRIITEKEAFTSQQEQKLLQKEDHPYRVFYP